MPKKLKWVTKPEGATVYDDAFYVRKQNWGTFLSIDANDNHLVTSLTEETCVEATRWYLKFQQDGGFTSDSTAYTGTVEHEL